METPKFLFLDGKITRTGKPLISVDNRSFRYGDGFFETIKYEDGVIKLADLHFERLFSSLDKLAFTPPLYFTSAYLENQIHELVKKNGHTKLARIRITIYRGDGGIYDEINHYPHHLIQSWELNSSNNKLNQNGLILDVFQDARISFDGFSHIKSNNYLSYAMAAIWAKKNKLNDALLLNSNNRLAEATIANVFIVKNGVIKTPELSEGPVQGVMRKHLLQKLRADSFPIEETKISIEDLEDASEIFLTNAIYGIRWVKQFRKSALTNQISSQIYNKLTPPKG